MCLQRGTTEYLNIIHISLSVTQYPWRSAVTSPTPLLLASGLFFRRGSEQARVGPCTMMLQYKQQQHNCNVARGNRTTATCDVTHTHFWRPPLHKHRPESCTMDTAGASPGVKNGRNVNLATHVPVHWAHIWPAQSWGWTGRSNSAYRPLTAGVQQFASCQAETLPFV